MFYSENQTRGLNMNRILFIASIATCWLLLSGCASRAKPNLVNGKYFMIGDSNCARYRSLSSTRILCFTKDGKKTGSRDYMTNQEISMYQHNQKMRQRESAELDQSLQNLNNSIQRQNELNNYNNQQFMNRNNVYKIQPLY